MLPWAGLRLTFRSILRLASVLACLLSTFWLSASAAREQEVFVLGTISDHPQQDYKHFQPMADYLARHLRHYGYERGELLLASSAEQLMQAMLNQRVDYVTETIFMAVRLLDDASARPLLKRWKKGVPEYHSLIFTRAGSGITDLRQLRGRALAFESRSSSSGFFVPAAALLHEGLSLQSLSTPTSLVAAGRVGYYFSGGELATAGLVSDGTLAAGAVSNLDWGNPEVFSPRLKRQLRIIQRSRSYPRAVEMVRSGLPISVREAIAARLLQVHRVPGAKRVLDAYQDTSKFSVLGEDFSASLDSVRQILQLTQPLLGDDLP